MHCNDSSIGWRRFRNPSMGRCGSGRSKAGTTPRCSVRCVMHRHGRFRPALACPPLFAIGLLYRRTIGTIPPASRVRRTARDLRLRRLLRRLHPLSCLGQGARYGAVPGHHAGEERSTGDPSKLPPAPGVEAPVPHALVSRQPHLAARLERQRRHALRHGRVVGLVLWAPHPGQDADSIALSPVYRLDQAPPGALHRDDPYRRQADAGRYGRDADGGATGRRQEGLARTSGAAQFRHDAGPDRGVAPAGIERAGQASGSRPGGGAGGNPARRPWHARRHVAPAVPTSIPDRPGVTRNRLLEPGLPSTSRR